LQVCTYENKITYTFGLLTAMMLVVGIGVGITGIAQAKEVNPAHDANNGLGNEKSFGTCKQEARNDNGCVAKFK
jgi:hypothetical protein